MRIYISFFLKKVKFLLKNAKKFAKFHECDYNLIDLYFMCMWYEKKYN